MKEQESNKSSVPVLGCASGMKEKNLWRSALIATAYSYQQQARPYLELLKTTEAYLNPRAGEKWLDLGCGSGRLIRSVWEKSYGHVKILGLDLSFTALTYAKKLLKTLQPSPQPGTIQLIQGSLSQGVGTLFRPESFHGVTAGLSISYADHWDPIAQTWDKKAYLKLIEDIFLLLRQGGSFVFSSNVPNYNYLLLGLKSWREIFLTWKLPLAILVTVIMLSQSRWLRDCARKGRFHYLPAAEIVTHLQSVGFREVKYELSYAKQAWVFFAVK